MIDVFISYSRHNLAFVQQLDVALSNAGKVCQFAQKRELIEGVPFDSEWWGTIKDEIAVSNNFLFVISPESLLSLPCNVEIAYARQCEKRLVPVLYCTAASEAATIQAIDAAVAEIADDIELSPTVSAMIPNLRSLTMHNWLAINRLPYVLFSDNEDFDCALEAVIRELDMDLAWIRLYSQLQLAAQIWADDAFSCIHFWSEERLRPARQLIAHLQPDLSEMVRDFIQPEADRFLEELQRVDLPHIRRSAIGELLGAIGDSRPGVGLREDGLPDIVWCEVPGGTVEIEGQPFTIQPFYIAKYSITCAQFQAFLDAPDGFEYDEWWEGLIRNNHKREVNEQCFKFVNHPRDRVSWFQAVVFTRWLTARLPAVAWPVEPARELAQLDLAEHGLNHQSDNQWQIRLPTEWEWQHAATGGDPAFVYPWGPDWENGWRCNTNESGLSRTTAVGMYPQGAADCGAFDMSGNVFEWCLNEPGKSESIHFESTTYRVLRGGSWRNSEHESRCSSPRKDRPDSRNYNYGFRVVCGRSPSP